MKKGVFENYTLEQDACLIASSRRITSVLKAMGYRHLYSKSYEIVSGLLNNLSAREAAPSHQFPSTFDYMKLVVILEEIKTEFDSLGMCEGTRERV